MAIKVTSNKPEYRCNHCGHFCKLVYMDRKHPPEFCPVDGTEDCYWHEYINGIRKEKK